LILTRVIFPEACPVGNIYAAPYLHDFRRRTFDNGIYRGIFLVYIPKNGVLVTGAKEEHDGG
jgi:hypothetical protein